MNKNSMLLIIATVAVAVAVAGWFWRLPQTLIPDSQTRIKPQTAPSVQLNPISITTVNDANSIAQLNPYTLCQSKSADGSDHEKALTQLVLTLLQAGNTPAELLQYDVSAAVWYNGYAASIAQAKHMIGVRALNIQEPSVLDMLTEWVQQELSDNPEAFARKLAAGEDFQVFVPTGLGTWNGSAYISPSLLFLQLSPQIPFTEFKQLVSGKTFLPLEFAVAMQSQLPERHLLQLLAQTRDPDQFAAGYHNYAAITPAWNLADVAAMHWQPSVLQALKQRGVEPSSIEGVVTGLDFALFTEMPRHSDQKNNPEVQTRLKQAQRDTVAYLLKEGYWAHGYQSEDGSWRFGNNFLNVMRFDAGDILALLPAGAPTQVFRRAEVKPQPVPAGSALADWVQAQHQLKTLAQQAYQQCIAAKQQLLEQEALLSRNDIQEQIFKWRGDKPLAELALAPLHQQDPAWLAWHWQMGGAQEFEVDEKLRDELAGHLHNPAELTAFLQTTELDSGTTAWLLMEILHKPEFLPAFNQRFAAKAPAFLYPVFSLEKDKELKALVDAGYDFGLQDVYGRNLYQWAFRAAPDAVVLMLQQGVSPFAQPLGPDALDLALEASYLQRELHPALPQILALLTDAEPSHLARLKRLQLYRPDLYQAVLKIKPGLQLPPDIRPNKLLSPPLL